MSRAWVVGLLVVACGGSCPHARTDTPKTEAGPAPQIAPEPDTEPAHAEDAAQEPAKPPAKAEDAVINPEFPEGASVAQAVAAIPKGTARANVDAETLGEPLQSEALYEPCKVGTQHFKLKAAVWNGRAVGVDVTTPNKPLASCIDKQVRNVTWPKAVRSLNTVEYSM